MYVNGVSKRSMVADRRLTKKGCKTNKVLMCQKGKREINKEKRIARRERNEND